MVNVHFSRSFTLFFLLVGVLLTAPISLEAGQVNISAAFGHPIMLSEPKQLNYVKIGLTGIPMENSRERTPVNLAIVLDKSGSMSGQKLEHAKQAAIMAVERLNADDILSVVAYDSDVEVLVPATKVSDRPAICSAIRRLEAGSNTALFAGVSKGAREVRKFLDRNHVNRIILLSDGLANEGPSSPRELGELGASLIREGISATTFGLGLGYNEDLMVELARRSDGNHAFIEKPEELARIFNSEFGDVLSVVAQEVNIEITCKNARPVRLLGRDGEIRDRTVITNLNQLYGKQEKFVLLEIESDGQTSTPPLVEAKVSFIDMKTRKGDTLNATVQAGYAKTPEEVSHGENREVMVSVVNLIANGRYKVATSLRDEGKIEDARKALLDNTRLLNESAERYLSPQLKDFATQNANDAKEIDDESGWTKNRKNMRKIQQSNDHQQSY